jgi:Restriction endonuclease
MYMTAHDLSRLSSLDFEELIHDLLEAEWSLSLEAFKSGRDGGVDLRHVAMDGGKTVVQCKHYLGSGLPKLLSHLRNNELPKIAALQPDRYVLVTSVALTPDNKDALVAALVPYVQTPSDVYGATEIAALLRRHPDIQKAHYKLWLTSTAVLERVLHSAEHCQTDFQIDRIRRKLPIFVQNEAYPRALGIIGDTRILIISGAPGIGKTTLAEMLIYAHLADGYAPVVIQADIAEGRKLYRSDRKQIFYFDDFLGQTYLGDRPEYFGRNQDAALSDFVEMVRHSEKARFILTTREHILGGALQRSERLAHSGLSDHRCVLELADYRRSQKARILYNHVYFSDFPAEYKAAVVADDFFLSIINHKNFSPRAIEWMSNYARIKRVAPQEYQRHVRELLDKPELIWTHAFESQISQAARNLLIVLYTTGASHDDLVDLEPAWIAYHEHCAKRYNYVTAPGDFRSALKELDGGFVTIREGRVDFLNASIRDFLAATLSASRERVRDVLEGATRFRQISGLWRLSSEPRYAELREHLLANTNLFFAALARLMAVPYLHWRREKAGMVGTHYDTSPAARVHLVISLADQFQAAESLAIVTLAFEAFFDSWRRDGVVLLDALFLIEALRKSEWIHAQGMSAIDRTLADEFFFRIEDARADDWLSILRVTRGSSFLATVEQAAVDEALAKYQASGALSERDCCESVSESEDFKQSLEMLRDNYGCDVGHEIELLEKDIIEDSEPQQEDDDSALAWTPSTIHEAPATDESIREMFGALVE